MSNDVKPRRSLKRLSWNKFKKKKREDEGHDAENDEEWTGAENELHPERPLTMPDPDTIMHSNVGSPHTVSSDAAMHPGGTSPHVQSSDSAPIPTATVVALPCIALEPTSNECVETPTPPTSPLSLIALARQRSASPNRWRPRNVFITLGDTTGDDEDIGARKQTRMPITDSLLLIGATRSTHSHSSSLLEVPCDAIGGGGGDDDSVIRTNSNSSTEATLNTTTASSTTVVGRTDTDVTAPSTLSPKTAAPRSSVSSTASRPVSGSVPVFASPQALYEDGFLRALNRDVFNEWSIAFCFICGDAKGEDYEYTTETRATGYRFGVYEINGHMVVDPPIYRQIYVCQECRIALPVSKQHIVRLSVETHPFYM